MLSCIGLIEQPPTIWELAQFIGCFHQNTRQLLLKLKNGGFQDREDKRKIRISLTEKSRQLEEQRAPRATYDSFVSGDYETENHLRHRSASAFEREPEGIRS